MAVNPAEAPCSNCREHDNWKNYQFALAEDIPFGYQYEQMKKFGYRRSPHGRVRSAWQHVELALSAESIFDETMKQQYFNYAQGLISESVLSEYQPASAKIRLDADLLGAYMPLFMKRMTRAEITPEDMANLYVSLGQVLAHEQENATRENRSFLSSCTEVLPMALQARTLQSASIMYPASPREESTELRGHSAWNHDSYFIVDGKKVPIQMTTATSERLEEKVAQYERPVIVLDMNRFISHALRRSSRTRSKYGESGTCPNRLDLLIALIVDETRGEQLFRSENDLLNSCSQLSIRTYLDCLATAA